MQFPKANSFPQTLVQSKIMGPNPLKLCEEMLSIADECVNRAADEARLGGEPTEPDRACWAKGANGSGCGIEANAADSCQRRAGGNEPAGGVGCRAIPEGSVVLDLGSGTGITTAMLAREYGYTAYAADLWSNPGDNLRFFQWLGLTNHQAIPVKVDASEGMPFAEGFFDAVVSTDSYNYFGRDAEFLDAKLLPYVKRGGTIAVCFPGMKRDCHSNPPACLLASWTPEQLDYIHDADWWRKVLQQSKGAEILAIREMECTEEAWADWLQCENEYAQGDRAAVEAGALNYLNSITVVLRKK